MSTGEHSEEWKAVEEALEEESEMTDFPHMPPCPICGGPLYEFYRERYNFRTKTIEQYTLSVCDCCDQSFETPRHD